MAQTITGTLVVSAASTGSSGSSGGGTEPAASLALSAGGETATAEPGDTITAEVAASAQGAGTFAGTITGRVVSDGTVLETLPSQSVSMPSGSSGNYVWSFTAQSAWAGSTVQAQFSADGGADWTTAGSTVVTVPAAPAEFSYAVPAGQVETEPLETAQWGVRITNVGGTAGVPALPSGASSFEGVYASWSAAYSSVSSYPVGGYDPNTGVLQAGSWVVVNLTSNGPVVPTTAPYGSTGTLTVTTPGGTQQVQIVSY